MLIFLDVNIEIRKCRRLERDIALGFTVDDVLIYLRDAEVAERDRIARYRKLAHIVLSESDMEIYWQSF
ncbi:MAG: hypothetical protein HY711_04300 [Candidatus Melainabacteria bacterium]|nr:hypothetical protein [Candidatus Melainabacteria bacterium]